jgi:hypothetical protein
MKDGRETGFLEEHRNGEPYALKGARTVRKGPERKGLAPVPRSQATLRSSSASTGSKAPQGLVECHHIGGGERVLREMSEKEFVDDAIASVTDAALFRGRRMGGHHDTAAHALRPHSDIGAVVELPLPSHFPSG